MSATREPGPAAFGSPFDQLPRAHGPPLGDCGLRAAPADFEVEEILGFPPDGEGDHLLLWVRKTDANTEWVARRLAELTHRPLRDLGYAGLKDRRAVTTQWFSLPRPGAGMPDWDRLAQRLGQEGIEILAVHPHRRKLRRGVLAGNRFRIRLRDLRVEPQVWEARCSLIRSRGVPNYFGDQRFGHQGSNLARAEALFRGRVRRPSRHQQGLWLSAARSQVFNLVLAERVRRGDWDSPQPGDCLNLAGSHSFFHAGRIDETLAERCADLDLHPTGPLWGVGEPPTSGPVRDLESAVAEGLPGWAEGLARAGLRQERRALRLLVPDLDWTPDCGGGWLRFRLQAGAYATAVLRELVQWGGDERVSEGADTGLPWNPPEIAPGDH